MSYCSLRVRMWNAINILYHWYRSVKNKRLQHAWHITVQTSDSKQNEVECSEAEQNEVECSDSEQNEVECREAEHTALLCSVIHITKPE